MTIDTTEQLFDILKDPSTTEVEVSPGKHDCTYYTCVTKINEKYYEFSYEASYNDGIQFWNSINLIEVRPVEVITIKWVKV